MSQPRSEDFRRRREDLLQDLMASPLRGRWWNRHTELADEVVRSCWQGVLEQVGGEPELAISATGGYGRRELCPYSDVDISVLVISMAQPNLDRTLKALFRALNRAFSEDLKIAVGYTYRPLADLPGLDSKSWTALLDSRIVAGSPEVFEVFQEQMWASLPGGDFLIDKIAERDAARARYGSTPFVVEPHLKEGAGGLRSAHAADWIRAALGERRRETLPEYRRLLRMRCLLHATAGKPLEHLNIGRRQELAEALGQDAFDLGGELSEAMSRLDREELSARQAVMRGVYALGPHAEAWNGSFRILPGASASEAAQACAQAYTLGLRSGGTTTATTGLAKAGEALDAICAPAEALREMDRAGVLQELLPELTACRHLMPRDPSHRWTVMEHTLQAIHRLDSLRPGTPLFELHESLGNKAALRLALLMHDVGKIDPSQRHSLLGEELTEAVCERWGAYADTRSMAGWLVREHLSMAGMMRSRDPQDPSTAQELGRLAQTEERLNALTLMTYADVGAVTPEAWTPVQDALLLELYSRTAAWLAGADSHAEPDVPLMRRQAAARILPKAPDAEALEAFLEAMPAAYLAGTPEAKMSAHLNMVQAARESGPQVEMDHDRSMGLTEITVASPDKSGHLSRILGVLYASDLSLLSLRAATMDGDPAMILDTFSVSAGRRSVSDRHARLVKARLEKLLRGEEELEALMRSLGKDPNRKQQILRWRLEPGVTAIWDVEAPRGRGLAYRCSRLIAEEDWNISLARLGQWAGRGSVSFYISRPSGEPIADEDIRRLLEKPGG